MVEGKNFVLFLPFLGGALYGLSYALSEKLFGSLSIPTYLFITSILSGLAVLLLHFLTPLKINFVPLANAAALQLFLAVWVTGIMAWLITLFAIKGVSANYASIGEICYPLFTVLFGYLIYNRTIDWHTVLGAALIMGGSFIIVADKLNRG